MKKSLPLICLLFSISGLAQEHFSGITTSKRVGILNAGVNPSELANLSSKFEVQFFSASINATSNKVGFSDLVDGNNLENLIFSGNEPINFNTDAELALPGFAIKALGWGFAITSGAHIKANVTDVDPTLGSALVGNGVESLLGSSIINNSSNQRVNATVWGEIGLSAAHKVFENEKHRINAGVTLKFLFPGSYANFGAGNFKGTITNTLGDLELSNASANLNFAYSGSLASNFTETSDYTSSLFGNLNGMATDIGVDYQLKSGSSYKLKVGASIKNIGSMTFKSDDNRSTNYELNVGTTPLNLNQFDDVKNLKDIEAILLSNGVLTEKSQNEDFKVKLPTVFNLYADFKVIPKINVTLFLKQKMNKDNNNDQITSQNSFSITPRVNVGFFEAYTPLAFNEISGTTAGVGLRFKGFFIGSNSIITALTSDSNQADAYLGYRLGFL